MSERISNERLREMASPTWRFVSDEYREAVRELLVWREWNEDPCRNVLEAFLARREGKPLTVGTTTRYPPMPREAWDKLRAERDALLGENTQLREQLDRLRARLLELHRGALPKGW